MLSIPIARSVNMLVTNCRWWVSSNQILYHVNFPVSDPLLEDGAQASPPLLPIWNSSVTVQTLGVGGLDEQFEVISRRVFASRMVPPSLVRQMGIKHVRGLLLYGPPGCGKESMCYTCTIIATYAL